MKSDSKTTVTAFLILILIITGCAGKPTDNEKNNQTSDLPIETRNFYLGIVPTPKNIPETTWNDTVNAYEEAGEIADVLMVWTEPPGIGQYEKLKENRIITALRVYGLKPVVTLNFATLKETPQGLQYVIDAPEGNADLSDATFRQLWISEAKNIAREFKPEYISLGNEINDYFYLYPDQIDIYLSLFDEAYNAIKEVSPQTKVFVVFSYTHLIDNNQWNLFEKFNNHADIIGLTTYPWKHYETPEEIPQDYYSKIKQYTNKPIAFTEIGWPSPPEKEQAEFLLVFLNRTKDLNLEMVNWLFLHEIKATGIISYVTENETMTISLKNSDGTKKEIYNVWLDVKEIKWTIKPK
jgi:hypothetical protein